MATLQQQRALLAHWLINDKQYMDERRWDGGGGTITPPTIPPGAQVLVAGAWSQVFSENPTDVAVPNYWCTNDVGGLFEHWYFVVPATGTYVVDVTDIAEAGDVFQVYGDSGLGEMPMFTTSNPSLGFCVDPGVKFANTADEAWGDAAFSQGSQGLINDRTYVFRILLTRSAEDFGFGCAFFDGAEHRIRIRQTA